MRNRILYITRNTIPYVKELMSLTGSVAGCILMQQLDFWFERFPTGYYKFQDITSHAMYKPGDSWCEELGISVDEFRTAFDKIGVRHKSKSQFDQAEDKFQGKFYCSYFDRRSQLTYYFRNHELLDRALDDLIVQVPGSTQGAGGGGSVKRPAAPAAVPTEPAVQQGEEGPFTVNGESPFTGNREAQLTGNGQEQSPVKRDSQPTGNGEGQATHLGNTHLQEVDKVRFDITETTLSQITTENTPQQPLEPSRGSAGAPADESCGSSSRSDEKQDIESLTFPAKTQPAERKELVRLLTRCPSAQRQAVLDEIEGAIRKGTLRSGIVPFGRYLITAIEADQFAPNLGVEILASREASAAAAARMKTLERRMTSEPEAVTEETLASLPVGMRDQLESMRKKAAERGAAKRA